MGSCGPFAMRAASPNAALHFGHEELSISAEPVCPRAVLNLLFAAKAVSSSLIDWRIQRPLRDLLEDFGRVACTAAGTV